MDPKLLADAVTTFLAPALPYLVEGGGKLVAEAGKQLGESGWEAAKALWAKLRPKVEAKPGAPAAAEGVAAAPASADAQEVLGLHLKQILAADAVLAAEVAKIVASAGPRATAVQHGDGGLAQGAGAMAAGKGGAVVGGDVHGGLSIGGRSSDG